MKLLNQILRGVVIGVANIIEWVYSGTPSQSKCE